MKNTTLNRRLLSLSLAAAVLAPVAGLATFTPATAAPVAITAETPVGGTQSLHPLDAAILQAGYERSGNIYQTNTVPFAKLTNGQTFVGDNTDESVYTRTWIPWTGELVIVAPSSHTVTTSTPAAGAVYVKGAILTKFLSVGAEDIFGRPTGNEVTGRAGNHAGAVAMASQTFQTGTGATSQFIWSAEFGAHPVKGAIRGLYNSGGGANTYGVPTTDERTVTVNGKVYQEQSFQGAKIRWSSSTGAFFV